MSCGVPAPSDNEAFTETTLEPQEWFHIYNTKNHPTKADEFNQGWGCTRFAPIYQDDKAPVHTYYAASTIRCTILESVLHDVMLNPPGLFELDSLKHYHLVKFRIGAPLQVVSFHSPFLPKLNMDRSTLIDCTAKCYPETQMWAQAAYNQRPGAQGIEYTSRRDDEGKCIMLFGQRMSHPRLQILLDEPVSLHHRGIMLALLASLNISTI
jgi:RES domain